MTANGRSRLAVAFLAALLASPALAGPPYQTDDPGITALHGFEIRPFVTAAGSGANWSGQSGVDVNYGLAENIAITTTFPSDFARTDSSNWRIGTGDIQLGAKVRLVNDHGFQLTLHPQVYLPTSSDNLESNRVRVLLPVLAQKDFGHTSLFGGGGYEINPGPGNRDFWEAGVAVTHSVTDRLSVGAEAYHQTPSIVGGPATTAVDFGITDHLGGPVQLLFSAGPSFTGGETGVRSYLGLMITL